MLKFVANASLCKNHDLKLTIYTQMAVQKIIFIAHYPDSYLHNFASSSLNTC